MTVLTNSTTLVIGSSAFGSISPPTPLLPVIHRQNNLDGNIGSVGWNDSLARFPSSQTTSSGFLHSAIPPSRDDIPFLRRDWYPDDFRKDRPHQRTAASQHRNIRQHRRRIRRDTAAQTAVLTSEPVENGEEHEGEEEDEQEEEEGEAAPHEDKTRMKRRSINAPDPSKPKVARLFTDVRVYEGSGGVDEAGSTLSVKGKRMRRRRQSVLEVLGDGRVRTSANISSVFSILEILLLCHVAPSSFQPCPSLISDKVGQSYDQSIFATFLLYFNETNRYICVNKRGNVYSKLKGDDTENLEDCVFIHSLVGSRYDVYRVKKYPSETKRCRAKKSSAEDQGVIDSSNNHSSTTSNICDRQWYLGVSKHGKVRIIKIKNSSPTPTWRTYFLQEWIHKNTYGQSNSPHHDVTLLLNMNDEKSTRNLASQSRDIGASSRKSAPIFQLIGQRKTNTMTSEPDVDPRLGTTNKNDPLTEVKKTDCLNLLRNDCSVKNKSRDSHRNILIDSFLIGNVRNRKQHTNRPTARPTKSSTSERKRLFRRTTGFQSH